MRPTMRSLSAPLLCLLLTACGYTAGFDGHGSAGRRVTIEVVGNDTYRQRFELPITRALEQEIPIYSNWQLVGPGSASAIVQARIEQVTGNSLAGGALGSPVREGGLDFILVARLLDARTGRVLQEAEILDRVEFRAAVGENEDSALAEGSEDIARKIILALERPF